MNGWNDGLAIGVAAVEGVLLIAALGWLIAVTVRLNKLKRQYRMLTADTGAGNLDEVFEAIHVRLAALKEVQQQQGEQLKQHGVRLARLKGRVSVHRFDAFSDSGNDLSFSLAMVNEEEDGVVITGIHGREQTFLYAKPIDKGQSAYLLTPEEKTAINLARQKG